MEAYIETLLQEVNQRSGLVDEEITSVYIGGGTPSLLPADLLERLLVGLRRFLPLQNVTEWTSEVNPGTLSASWLDIAVRYGVNRISLGMQAAQQSILELLGRIHDFRAVENSFAIIRKAGIQNISVDLMFGIPGQSLKDWHETLDATISLKPSHISAYGLIPERGTPLLEQLNLGRFRLPEPETEREMYETACRLLASHGYRQYEISNFAKPGMACVHNIGYWRQTPYLGIGLSASSMLSKYAASDHGVCYLRQANPRTLSDYERLIRGHTSLRESEWIYQKEARFETMMLGLRMTEGVSDAFFQQLHGRSLENCFGSKLRELALRGLTEYADFCWRLTRQGMDFQNTVLVELMD